MVELIPSFSAILAPRRSALAAGGAHPVVPGWVLAISPARPALASSWHIAKRDDEERERARHRTGRDSSPRGLGGWPRGKLEVSNEDEVDSALIERARSGDAEAFAELFALHREKIHRLCGRMLDDVASAEDATSEVYLRARRALASYDPARPFLPWLRTLASNYCIDQLRRRKKERSLFSEADGATLEPADDRPGALTRIARRQEHQALLDALDRLPAQYRVPLVLRFYRDLDYDAVAEILGVTRNQVGSLLFRAKKRLREELEGQS